MAPVKMNADRAALATSQSTRDDALVETKLAALRAALDIGLAELDAGLGVEVSIDELMTEISNEVGV